MTTAVMWFRRDLRLSDNPALLEALRAADEVVPLFVIDDALWGPAGDNRRAFLVGCLRALDDAMGGALIVRHGDPIDVVAQLAREVDAVGVFAAEDFGPYGRRRDAPLDLTLVGSAYAVAPGAVLNKQGDPYKVFTPFSRAWLDQGWDHPVRAPSSPRWASGVKGRDLPKAPTVTAELPQPGEAVAKRAARRFYDSRLTTYERDRNDPGADRTSRLSPYLKWGCVHPRQLLAQLGRDQSDVRFRTELCWREFYADVLFHRPDTARQAFDRTMSGIRVDDDEARFVAWCEGRTGYPLVDAGMRQLLAEGWMHNRVRMIVASFLVKDLHLDWTRGARHFMRHLVDGDLASNQHGWQWTAGTGTDAAPFFRIFNPVSQSERFDPDGTFIRRWVPELSAVEGKAIHAPWTLGLLAPAGYPPPMIDHATERAEALARYASRARS